MFAVFRFDSWGEEYRDQEAEAADSKDAEEFLLEVPIKPVTDRLRKAEIGEGNFEKGHSGID